MEAERKALEGIVKKPDLGRRPHNPGGCLVCYTAAPDRQRFFITMKSPIPTSGLIL
jgi:hypothetical protein